MSIAYLSFSSRWFASITPPRLSCKDLRRSALVFHSRCIRFALDDIFNHKTCCLKIPSNVGRLKGEPIGDEILQPDEVLGQLVSMDSDFTRERAERPEDALRNRNIEQPLGFREHLFARVIRFSIAT
jgi:hypothetical protein